MPLNVSGWGASGGVSGAEVGSWNVEKAGNDGPVGSDARGKDEDVVMMET